ncbi:hypothetical protein ALPO108162_07920 [Alicyclobacillus pomorum]
MSYAPCRLLDSCHRGKGRLHLKRRAEHTRHGRQTSLRRHTPARETVKLKRLRRQLRKEARAWGLAENDLLSLVVSLSETIRDQVPGAGSFDTKQVVQWIRHPMFPLMLQWIGSSVMNALSNNDAPPSNQEAPSTQTPPPWPNVPRTPAPAPHHAVPWAPPSRPPGSGYARPGAPTPGVVPPEFRPPAPPFPFY